MVGCRFHILIGAHGLGYMMYMGTKLRSWGLQAFFLPIASRVQGLGFGLELRAWTLEGLRFGVLSQSCGMGLRVEDSQNLRSAGLLPYPHSLGLPLSGLGWAPQLGVTTSGGKVASS